jgi:hypothetical protein
MPPFHAAALGRLAEIATITHIAPGQSWPDSVSAAGFGEAGA